MSSSAMSICVALLCALLATSASAIDVWDQAGEDDNGTNTDNMLTHGAVQVHDLGAEGGVADEDWFVVRVAPYSSVEVVVDSYTGDLWGFTSPQVTRRSDEGTTLQTSVTILDQASARRLAWINDTDEIQLNYIRVGDADCSTTCSAHDQYTIRMRETQIALARFNNSGTQVTVLMVQNASHMPINSKVYFWSSGGNLVGTYAITNQQPKMLSVIPTQTIVAGQSGSITIAHNGPHYGLNAKAVALEPATGFSFDTPGVIRP